jgi:hypothetical protein
MKCPQCSNDMIRTKATAFGEEYDYCRTCKKELKELGYGSANNNVRRFTGEVSQEVKDLAYVSNVVTSGATPMPLPPGYVHRLPPTPVNQLPAPPLTPTGVFDKESEEILRYVDLSRSGITSIKVDYNSLSYLVELNSGLSCYIRHIDLWNEYQKGSTNAALYGMTMHSFMVGGVGFYFSVQPLRPRGFGYVSVQSQQASPSRP